MCGMRPIPDRRRRHLRAPAAAILAVVLGCSLCVPVVSEADPEILRVRHWTAPDHTRVVVDLSEPAAYEVRRVANPERISLNILSASFDRRETVALGDGLIRRIRHNALSGRAQLVLDLQLDANFSHFALPAADGRPARIVIDVKRPPESRPATAASDRPIAGSRSSEPSDAHLATAVPAEPPAAAATDDTPVPAPAPVAEAVPTEPFVVIIDPGHGGMDPGAIRHGVQEKDVVLQISRELARMINRLPGYRAVLTRSGDYFVSLGKRVRIAKEKRGDLFLSIHANTHPRSSLRGMEIYFLSLKGATDREAQELADKENAADLVGLAPDEPRDDSVLSILMDLRMTRVLDRSSLLAEKILEATRSREGLEARRVKQARFQVLRTLAMPSVMVELAYLSNRDDRRLLDSREGRSALASTVVAGILDYRGDPARQLQVATGQNWQHRYKVRPGDTLWDLARRHGTTIAEIRQRNQLNSSGLRIGQFLHLPGAD